MVFGHFIPFLCIWSFAFWHLGSLHRSHSKRASRCPVCIGFGMLAFGATGLLLIPVSFSVSSAAFIFATNKWKTKMLGSLNQGQESGPCLLGFEKNHFVTKESPGHWPHDPVRQCGAAIDLKGVGPCLEPALPKHTPWGLISPLAHGPASVSWSASYDIKSAHLGLSEGLAHSQYTLYFSEWWMFTAFRELRASHLLMTTPLPGLIYRWGNWSTEWVSNP